MGGEMEIEMLKNKLLVSALTAVLCVCATLASCGDGTRVEEHSGNTTTHAAENQNIVEEIGSDIKDGAENIGNGMQNGMGNVEDATHGIIEDKNEVKPEQGVTGNDSVGNNSGNMRMRHHRSPVPFGK